MSRKSISYGLYCIWTSPDEIAEASLNNDGYLTKSHVEMKFRSACDDYATIKAVDLIISQRESRIKEGLVNDFMLPLSLVRKSYRFGPKLVHDYKDDGIFITPEMQAKIKWNIRFRLNGRMN